MLVCMSAAPNQLENAKLLYGAGDGHAGGFEGMCPSGGGMDCCGLSGLADGYTPTDAQKEMLVYQQAVLGVADAFVQQKKVRDANRAAQITARNQDRAAQEADPMSQQNLQTYGMIGVAVLAVGAGLFFLTKKK